MGLAHATGLRVKTLGFGVERVWPLLGFGRTVFGLRVLGFRALGFRDQGSTFWGFGLTVFLNRRDISTCLPKQLQHPAKLHIQYCSYLQKLFGSVPSNVNLCLNPHPETV